MVTPNFDEVGQRNRGLKRAFPSDEPMQVTKQSMGDPMFQLKNWSCNDESRIPDGWLDCPAYGQDIGCIIASKVPLCDSYSRYIPSGKIYTPNQLGLVIDLTNTTRYYHMSDWTGKGVKYLKIKCKGRDEVPDSASVTKFVNAVSQFFSQRRRSKKYILVHCTHGHNRTGYMIVHYLVRKERISVTEAIDMFTRARPPGIYKQDYIDALYMFYLGSKPERVVHPKKPEWKNDEKSSPEWKNYVKSNPEWKTDEKSTPEWKNDEKTNVMAHDDVLGDAVCFDQQKELRKVCYQLLDLDVGDKGNLQFPGSHPVSLNRENLQLLRQSYYYATWKADGTRYMMLITSDGCYLIDRKFNFRKVRMWFPCRQKSEDMAGKTHQFTLLDGEMIIDTNSKTGKQERRYLIYDLMALNRKSVIELPFNHRWEMIEREVISPRERERDSKSKRLCHDYALETFHVKRKEYWLLSTATKILKDVIPKLPHAADGIILQGWDDPYVPRTHEGLLKWKYPEMNSVDFLFEMGEDNRPLLSLLERGSKKLMGGSMVIFRGVSDLAFYSKKIIECFWDPEQHVWVFLRIRSDKEAPNEFNTYLKVLISINDKITEDVLLNQIGKIVRLPMYVYRDNEAQQSKQHK